MGARAETVQCPLIYWGCFGVYRQFRARHPCFSRYSAESQGGRSPQCPSASSLPPLEPCLCATPPPPPAPPVTTADLTAALR